VLKIDVADPVSGAKLTNLTAPFQDTHDGRVFFFASEASYLAFRAEPEKYAPRRVAPSRENE
jgi:YHS domain-containing protein